jgi:hypothetical protein
VVELESDRVARGGLGSFNLTNALQARAPLACRQINKTGKNNAVDERDIVQTKFNYLSLMYFSSREVPVSFFSAFVVGQSALFFIPGTTSW